jgi:hypothetical protein
MPKGCLIIDPGRGIILIDMIGGVEALKRG